MSIERAVFSERFARDTGLEQEPGHQDEYATALVEIFEREFEHSDELGHGKSADIWMGRSDFFNNELCIKSIRDPGASINNLSTEFRLHEAFLRAGGRAPRLIGYVEAKLQSKETRSLIAMETVRGENLEDWIRRLAATGEKISQNELNRFLSDLKAQIELAHDGNVFHRDLHLRNAMRDEQGRAVLIDFGDAAFAFRGASDSEIYSGQVAQDGQLVEADFLRKDEQILKDLRAEFNHRSLIGEPVLTE